jgi:hypothetical protein
MEVLRGYPGNESSNLTRVAKAADGEEILSGMIVQLDSDGLADIGISDVTKPVYVAYHDWTDGDAMEAGLVLFDVSGNYEIQTGYVADGETITEGTPLTANTSGELIAATDGAAEAIIGYATREVAGSCIRSLAGEASGALDLNVVSFTTKWLPVEPS